MRRKWIQAGPQRDNYGDTEEATRNTVEQKCVRRAMNGSKCEKRDIGRPGTIKQRENWKVGRWKCVFRKDPYIIYMEPPGERNCQNIHVIAPN